MASLPRLGTLLAAALALAACGNPFGPDDDLEDARRKWRRQFR